MATMQVDSERRAMRRFDMRLPASVRVTGMEAADFVTETRNVSAKGVFFYMDRPLDAGTHIEVTMTFPPHITFTESLRVRFSARVLRMESAEPSGRIGVAAAIQEYEFLSSPNTPESAEAEKATKQ
jgi:hypothetical protein